MTHHTSELSIAARPFAHPDVVAMIERIQQYYVAVYGGPDRDAPTPEDFTPPAGVFLVGYLDGGPVARGGWRRRPDGSAEIKRMFVDAALRGRGVARRMLAELEATARAAGVRTMVLNTGYKQPEAMALYESSGYERTDERYGHYEQTPGSHFYRKPLDSPPELSARPADPTGESRGQLGGVQRNSPPSGWRTGCSEVLVPGWYVAGA